MHGIDWRCVSLGKSTLGGGSKIIVTLYCFSKVPCLNFNYVIIMKDFHNFFAYYSKSEPKEIKCQKKNIFESLYDVMLKYTWTKNVCHNVLIKKCEYIQEMIGMILKFYENFIIS
jgi:hypothetical protein